MLGPLFLPHRLHWPPIPQRGVYPVVLGASERADSRLVQSNGKGMQVEPICIGVFGYGRSKEPFKPQLE